MKREELALRDLGQISRGNCPVCLQRGFVIGPLGGSSLNIECANLACRQRYNVAFRSGTAMMGHPIPRDTEWPSEPRH
jgi:hypothetical protein